MSTNRVVVTGYGVTSPIGNTPEEFWNSLHDGKIGIRPITKFDASMKFLSLTLVKSKISRSINTL